MFVKIIKVKHTFGSTEKRKNWKNMITKQHKSFVLRCVLRSVCSTLEKGSAGVPVPIGSFKLEGVAHN